MRLIYLILDHAARRITDGAIAVPTFDDFTNHQVHYHIGLCVQAKYLVAEPQNVSVRVDGKSKFTGLVGVTWKGHEALDELRAEHG